MQFTAGTVRLAGTLTLPDTPGPHPSLVLIQGGQAITGMTPTMVVDTRFLKSSQNISRHMDLPPCAMTVRVLVARLEGSGLSEPLMIGPMKWPVRSYSSSRTIGLIPGTSVSWDIAKARMWQCWLRRTITTQPSGIALASRETHEKPLALDGNSRR